MKSIELSEVSALAPLMHHGSREPLILTRNGRALAAIVPLDDADAESLLLSINPRFQEILKHSQDRLESEGAISSEEVRKRLGLPSGTSS